MDNLRKALGKYWVLYYLCYVVSVVVLVWWYWDDLLRGDDPLFRLAAIFGVSAGIASFIAISVELIGRMVLLIPAAVRTIREQGRQEGREEGLEEGLQRANAQWEAWLQRRLRAEANNEPFDEPPPSNGNGKVS